MFEFIVPLVAFKLIVQLVAYLVGGIPFGFLVAKARAGIDIRQHGSGNIGATNVGRVLGCRYFLLVFALDFSKGAIPVALACWMAAAHRQPIDPQGLPDPWFETYFAVPELVGLAAILGHMFPVYLKGGGKGVATTIGVMLVLAPVPSAIGLAVWAILALSTRMVSVGSIGFAAAFALGYFLSIEHPLDRGSLPLSMFILLIACLIVVRHVPNIGRILRGTESRFTFPWTSGKGAKTTALTVGSSEEKIPTSTPDP